MNESLLHFDYLAFTIHPDKDAPVSHLTVASTLSCYLGRDWVKLSGFRNYDSSLRFLDIGALVCYGGLSQRGTIHVILPGAACEILGSKILPMLQGFEANSKVVYTRHDIAIDTPGLAAMCEFSYIAAHVISSYTKNAREYLDYALAGIDKKIMGRTLYFGSRQSERMVRVYLKQGWLGTDEPFSRTEMEVKGGFCNQVMHEWTSGKYDFADLACVDFKDFFDVEMFLGISFRAVSFPVGCVEKRKVARTLAYLLGMSTSISRLFKYYETKNVIEMIEERARDNELKKFCRRHKTPVGNTGVTNWSFDDILQKNEHLESADNLALDIS